MSDIEYNSLIFQISRRLDELNEPEQLLFMCRNRLPSGNEEGFQNSLALLKKLEERLHLGPGRLEVLKDIIKGVKEWTLLGTVEKFERKRREYKDLLEHIIRALDELSDLERVMSVCRGRMPEETELNIVDVRSLFEVLEGNSVFEINQLGILKQMLIDLERKDLVKAVDEFDRRRCEDEEYESRKARAGVVVSTFRGAIRGIIGEVTVHCTFRKLSGAMLVVGTGLILRKCSSLEEFAEAFTVAVLPAAAALQGIGEGSVCFTITAENTSALEELWRRYQDGALHKDLQEFLVTDDIIQLADGEGVMVTVYINKKEYTKVLEELRKVERQVLVCPDAQEAEKLVKTHRRYSDSYLYCKGLKSERPVHVQKPVMSQAKFLEPERLDFIWSYLKMAEDSHSVTTETTDSGVEGSLGAPSEFALVAVEASENKDKVMESILSQTSDAEEIVLQLMHSLELDQASLEHRRPGTQRLIHYVSTKAKYCNRLDVVRKLREKTLPGTTGPLLPENLDVRNVPIRQIREITIILSGGDEWKIVAERLGLTLSEIRYLDKRVMNPFDAALRFISEQSYMSVGDLYDVLNECGFPAIADLL